MGFDTASGLSESSDVDHDQTTNRTHSGDSIDPSSSSPGSITVGGGDTVNRIEFGVESNVSYPGASSNSDFSSSTNVNKDISFSASFSSQPAVFVDQADDVGGTFAEADDTTTSGFTLTLRNYTQQDRSSVSRDINWVAIG